MKVLSNISMFTFMVAFTIAGAVQAAPENVTVLPADPNIVIQDSSAHNRMGKKISLQMDTAGGTMTGTGLQAGYFLDRNSQVLVDVYGYSLSLTDEIVSSMFANKAKLKGSSAGVHYKRFLGNSFFVRGGVEQRRVMYERTYSGFLTPTAPQVSTFTGEAINAVVGIGNDWQWGNLSVGFDWLRLYAPMSHNIRREYYSQVDEDLMQSREERYLKNGSAMTGFHLGLSF